MIGHALLAFAAGAALGAAALYAAWVYLLPIGTVSDVVSEDRAIASYVLLFSFHIVNALFDQCTMGLEFLKPTQILTSSKGVMQRFHGIHHDLDRIGKQWSLAFTLNIPRGQ